MAAHIFISYSKQDIDFVRYLRALLENEGFTVWMDEARLNPSARWWRDIERSIDSCGAFIVVMTPAAYESDWVEREILRAENRKKTLYPVLAAGDPWSRLANIQYEDLRAGLRAQLSEHFIHSLQRTIGVAKPPEFIFAIEHADILQFEADVVALKYTRKHHGAARLIANILTERADIPVTEVKPAVGSYSLVETKNLIRPDRALFVGLPAIADLGYEGIREFGSNILNILSQETPHIKHLCMTIHGPGAGLDEIEALLAQIGGYLDALRRRRVPLSLERITIVEHNAGRVMRMQKAVEAHLAEASYAQPLTGSWGYRITTPQEADEQAPLEEAGTESERRPFAYVAMSPEAEFDDLFYYGIQGAVHAQGLLCVRIEKQHFTEDLLEQAKERISAAALVIAELSNPEPNVYLQLGYAWGAGRQVILVAKHEDAVTFEANNGCIYYQSIKSLENALLQNLQQLKTDGVL